ncbi:HNH endonuclease [Arthrobacter dokdonensis]|uniref:HNH endonuclease n=1 Tax=Arthrobacter dokdonellae TaxID=2211210 RepID=UPI001013CC02|nr:HNH endonuclease [Arthrobacter dokdonellae]
MAAPEWQDDAGVSPDPSEASAILGMVPDVSPALARSAGAADDVADAARALVGVCGGFFDPAVLAQLDAALAHELAARARERAVAAADLFEKGLREGRAAAFVERAAAHAGACKAAATKAGRLAGEATAVVSAFGGTVTAQGFDPAVVDAVSGAALIDVIAGLEEAKNALAAAQIQAEALFTAQQRLSQARAGVPKDKLGKGVGLQIGFARHESGYRGRQLAELAAVLVRELPHTMDAVTAGIIGEDRARIVATETVFLTADHRAEVDALISADHDKLAAMGSKELAAAARDAAYRLEPEVFTKRRDKAVTERHVSLRPAADGMTLLSALIPLKHGVTILKTLTRAADTATAAGDERGRGQLMADALIHRLTQHIPCDDGAGTVGYHRGPAIPHAPAETAPTRRPGLCTTVTEPDIMIELVMTDRALFEGANDPAIIVGHEPIPAPEARAMVLGIQVSDPVLDARPDGSGGGSMSGQEGGGDGASTGPDEVNAPNAGRRGFSPRTWLRRLFTHPDSGALLTMDSRARIFPDGMKEFLRLQYQRCANPYCGAPIRHYDHIKSWAAGGPTSTTNGQGLCAACNQAKEAPGWLAEPANGPPPGAESPDAESPDASLPRTTTSTPTGHRYTSVAPPLPGQTRGRRPGRRR